MLVKKKKKKIEEAQFFIVGFNYEILGVGLSFRLILLSMRNGKYFLTNTSQLKEGSVGRLLRQKNANNHTEFYTALFTN